MSIASSPGKFIYNLKLRVYIYGMSASSGSAERFLQALGTLKPAGEVLIFTAEAPLHLYSNPHVLQALRRAKTEKEMKAFALTGPVLTVPEDKSEDNGLMVLKREGVIDVLHRPLILYLPGFWVIEKEAGFAFGFENPYETDYRQERRATETFRFYQETTLNSQVGEDGEFNGQVLPLIATPSGYARLLAEDNRMLVGDGMLAVRYMNPEQLLGLQVGKKLLTRYPDFRPIRG